MTATDSLQDDYLCCRMRYIYLSQDRVPIICEDDACMTMETL